MTTTTTTDDAEFLVQMSARAAPTFSRKYCSSGELAMRFTMTCALPRTMRTAFLQRHRSGGGSPQSMRLRLLGSWTRHFARQTRTNRRQKKIELNLLRLKFSPFFHFVPCKRHAQRENQSICVVIYFIFFFFSSSCVGRCCRRSSTCFVCEPFQMHFGFSELHLFRSDRNGYLVSPCMAGTSTRDVNFRHFIKICERAFAAKCHLQRFETDVYDLELCRRGPQSFHCARNFCAQRSNKWNTPNTRTQPIPRVPRAISNHQMPDVPGVSVVTPNIHSAQCKMKR